MFAFAPIAENEPPLRVVICSAQLRCHERAEKFIDEIEQTLAAAEIFREQQRGGPAMLRPRCGVTLKYARVRLTKAVDALLHIADQESIGLVGRPAYRLQNLVLGRIDILVLIDEHPLESLLPFPRQFRGLAIAPEEPKRVLFQVMKINLAHRALCGFESLRKIACQCQQSAHKRRAPLPILEHWI